MPAPPLPSLTNLPLPVQLLLGAGIVLFLASFGAAAVIRAAARYRSAGQQLSADAKPHVAKSEIDDQSDSTPPAVIPKRFKEWLTALVRSAI